MSEGQMSVDEMDAFKSEARKRADTGHEKAKKLEVAHAILITIANHFSEDEETLLTQDELVEIFSASRGDGAIGSLVEQVGYLGEVVKVVYEASSHEEGVARAAEENAGLGLGQVTTPPPKHSLSE